MDLLIDFNHLNSKGFLFTCLYRKHNPSSYRMREIRPNTKQRKFIDKHLITRLKVHSHFEIYDAIAITIRFENGFCTQFWNCDWVSYSPYRKESQSHRVINLSCERTLKLTEQLVSRSMRLS